MFKKCVNTITLACFFNYSCVTPVLATYPNTEEQDGMPIVRRSIGLKKKEDQYVFDYQDTLQENSDEFDLIYNDHVIAEFKKSGNKLLIRGKDQHDLWITGLPDEVNDLIVNAGGAVIFDVPVVCKDVLGVETPSSLVTFHKGFHIKEDKGYAFFASRGLELMEESYAKVMQLNNMDNLTVKRGGKLEIGRLQSKDPLNNLNVIGELIANVCTLKEIGQLNNSGIADFSSGLLKIAILNNKGGKLKAPLLTLTEQWSNRNEGSKKGEITVTECLQANVKRFDETAESSIYGLAIIQALDGNISGRFQARKATVAFGKDFNFHKSGQLLLQDHLTLHSDGNLKLYGDIKQVDFNWPLLKLSRGLEQGFRKLKAGFFITGKNISKHGNVTTVRGNIVYQAKEGQYVSKNGINDPGVFNNTLSIIAHSASLADQMRSLGSAHLDVQEKLELLGERDIAKEFSIVARELQQRPVDKTKAGVIFAKVANVELAGQLCDE